MKKKNGKGRMELKKTIRTDRRIIERKERWIDRLIGRHKKAKTGGQSDRNRWIDRQTDRTV